MSKPTGSYPRPRLDAGGAGIVAHAGGALLTAVVGRVGLDQALSAALAPWRKPLAVHDPAKVVLDLAVTLALGGDCLADIARDVLVAEEVDGVDVDVRGRQPGEVLGTGRGSVLVAGLPPRHHAQAPTLTARSQTPMSVISCEEGVVFVSSIMG